MMVMSSSGIVPVPPALDIIVHWRRYPLVTVSRERLCARAIIAAPAPATHGTVTVPTVVFSDVPAIEAAAVGAY